jgi:hypothetical protein
MKSDSKVQYSVPQVCITKDGKRFSEHISMAEGQYLNIKQWGVRLKLTDKNMDAYYVSPNKGYGWFKISSKSLDEVVKNSKVCVGANRSDTIARVKPGDDNFGSPWTVKELTKIGKKVGEYYFIDEPGQACFGAEKDIVKESGIRTKISQLRANLPTHNNIELIP